MSDLHSLDTPGDQHLHALVQRVLLWELPVRRRDALALRLQLVEQVVPILGVAVHVDVGGGVVVVLNAVVAIVVADPDLVDVVGVAA
eukprot:5176735-Alexandrium_andersonii.AAC.1